MGFVTQLAKSLWRPFFGVDLYDLISEGVIGLLHAIERFDKDRRTKFTTYAAPRVRGAIIDVLRAFDPIPRLSRKRGGDFISAVTILTGDGSRDPTNGELCRTLNLPEEKLPYWRQDALLCKVRTDSYDSVHSATPRPMLVDQTSTTPSSHVENEEWWSRFLRCLPLRHRVIATLYYRHSWTMKRIGRHVLLVEGRISQIVAELQIRLRTHRSKAEFADIPKGPLARLIDVLPLCHRIREAAKRRTAMRQASK